MTLDEMRKVDIRTVDPATLHDRRDVRIDSRQPREKRIASYLKQIGNPYCYVDDGVVVKIGFMNTRETIDDRLEGYGCPSLRISISSCSSRYSLVRFRSSIRSLRIESFCLRRWTRDDGIGLMSVSLESVLFISVLFVCDSGSS